MSIQDNAERRELYEFVVREVKGAHTILDCACAEGYGTDMIAAGNPSAACTGVDLSAKAIADAKNRYARSNVSFEEGNALSLRFPDGHFDAAVSCHTIEHFNAADQKKLVSEYRRVLKPGGTLVIATPDLDVWRLMGIAGQQEDHIRELTKTEFMNEVKDGGFEIKAVYGQNPLKEGNFTVRKALNIAKKLDVLGVRKVLGSVTKKVDQNTRPVSDSVAVVPLMDGDKASVTVLVARKT